MRVPKTSAAWAAEADPSALARCYRGPTWFPALRLFAVACCRRAWHLLPEGACRELVDAAEGYARAEVAKLDLRAAERRVRELHTWAYGMTPVPGLSPWMSMRDLLLGRAAEASLCCAHGGERPGYEAPQAVQELVFWSEYHRFPLLATGLRADGGWESAQAVRGREAVEQMVLLRRLLGDPFAVAGTAPDAAPSAPADGEA